MRVLFVLPVEDSNGISQQISEALPSINQRVVASSGKMNEIHKCFSMKEYAEFLEKYPLLCLPGDETQTSELRKVRASSRFPSEIKKDSLFLGNMTNLLNRDYFQLTMLKIKTIFYLAKGPFADIDQHFNCVHIPVDEMEKPQIEFDELSEQV